MSSSLNLENFIYSLWGWKDGFLYFRSAYRLTEIQLRHIYTQMHVFHTHDEGKALCFNQIPFLLSNKGMNGEQFGENAICHYSIKRARIYMNESAQ